MHEAADSGSGEPDWNIIRTEYASRAFAPRALCARHGITMAQLRYRRECEGWPNANGKGVKPADLVVRMLSVLARQVTQLENTMDEPIERQANTLATQVKILDKLIELGAAQRNVEPPTRRDMTDLRTKLARRIDQSRAG